MSAAALTSESILPRNKGLLYVHDNQTLICTSSGTTIIHVGSLDYLCNKMLTKLLEEAVIEQVADKPADVFQFDERDEVIVQRYLGTKNELFNTSFIAAMT